LEGETLLVFADDWGQHPSSAQHLLRRFLPRNRVIWINTVGLRLPRPSARDVGKMWRKLLHWLSPRAPKPTGGNPWGLTSPFKPEIHELPLAPVALGPWTRRLNAWLLRRATRSWLTGAATPFIVTTLPLTADLGTAIPQATFIYYLVDDYASWPGLGGRLVRALDEAQAAAADLIVAASQALADLHRTRARHPVEYLPHGVDVAHFAAARKLRAERTARGQPAGADVIFFGALDERIDRSLLTALVRARPDRRFLLLGPGFTERNTDIAAANVQLRGAAPYAELPSILSECSVALLPYVRGPFGDRLSPLKAREALAAGLPIVATDVPELRRLPRGVHLGRSVDALLAALDRALAAPDDVPELATLADDSWDARAEQFSALLLAARAARRPA
jgi:glycosyltransferase involved in cell wall biosynthesis